MKKGYHLLTQDQIDEILRTYQETGSTKLTAKKLGVSYQRVVYHVKKAGLPLTNQRENACRRHRVLLERLAAEGASLSEIARQIGTNKRHVKKFLVEQGIPYTPIDQSGTNNPNWRGGRRIDADGYVLIHCPDHPYCTRHGYMREHRLVMEETIGRYLSPKEVVHHIDGDKLNNDPSNLKLYSSNGEHLAESLAGQVPTWTEDGLRRMREGVARSAKIRRRSSLGRFLPDDEE